MNQKGFYLRYRNRRMNHDKRLVNAMQSAILNIYNLAASNTSIPSTKTVANTIRKKLKPAITAIVRDGMLYGLKDAEEKYGKELPLQLKKEVDRETLEQLGINNVITTIVNDGMKQVKTISRDIVSSLNTIFEESTVANESVQQLTRRIKERAVVDAIWKAKRIAQTETTRAWNAGTFEGYKASGVVDKKEWIANPFGTNPRDWHVAYAGTQVKTNEPFTLDGEDLMYPGDMSASTRNVINCHCGMMPVVGRIGAKG